jgi:hypothetical protein
MVRLGVVFSSKAVGDLDSIHPVDRGRILLDIQLLEVPPWPAGKAKPLRGTFCWEMKCGDFRILYRRMGDRLRIERVVNRKDLKRALRNL